MTMRCSEAKVRFPGDPLAAVSRLAAAQSHEDYVVYERAGQWSFAYGALVEVRLDRCGVRIRGAVEDFAPWDGDPLAHLQRMLDRIPVDGWRAYGWAAFELAYAKDGDTSHLDDQPLLQLVVPRTEVRLAHGWAYLRSVDEPELARARSLLAGGPAAARLATAPVAVRQDGAEDYQRAVKLAVEQIAVNQFQKVILSRVVPVEREIDFVGTYLSGRRGNRPARSFLLHLGGIETAGFSPEVVVDVDAAGRVVTQPLAGTRMLTDDPAENRRLRAELLANAKEIYEHAISVKAACEDLHTVCEAGSVSVEEFMVVRERGTVQHLASRVSGQLAPGRKAWDAFGAVFPAVTASGVPKQAVYASIRHHEGRARGLYSGAVLTVESGGAMDAALVLRAVYRRNGATWLQAGAGIVEQSRPEREFEETCEKLESVARYLVPSNDPTGEPPC